MTPAIEELEKLASDSEPDSPEFAEHIRNLATRLRTEERDGKREAFVTGVEWRILHDMEPGCDNDKRCKAEAARRYP